MHVDASEERLTGLSVAELEALADGLLAPGRQARLDELLTRNGAGALDVAEARELDRLLELVDQLTLVKARARYTLGQLKAAATVT
jgi:anti-sigma factor RsiW